MRLLNLFICSLLIILFAFASNAQTVPDIEGPELVCIGSCETFFINNGPNNVEFEVTYPFLGSGQTNDCFTLDQTPGSSQSALICFRCPGTYILKAIANGKYLDSMVVYTTEQNFLEIFEVGDKACNNSDVEIYKFCKNTVYTFSVTDTIFPVSWSVQNAKNYKILGNGKIEVEWNDSGSCSLTATQITNNGCISTGVIRGRVIDGTGIEFTTNGDEFCANEIVSFEPKTNLNEVTSFEWDFGNGEKSTEVKPTTTYSQSGKYLVSLTINSNCSCSATTTKEITIKDVYQPTIDCKSTICENTEMTYTTSADCEKFTWNVIGDGKIVRGGGITDRDITIEWGKGPQGLIELSAANCNFNLCPEKATFEIPIISDLAKINGPQVVCWNGEEYYSLIKYGATYYNWTITNGRILAGQGSHGVLVKWYGNGNLKVDYENCFLECGGSEEISVIIKDNYNISVPSTDICQGSPISVVSKNNIGNPVIIDKWEVRDQNNNLLFTQNLVSNINYSAPNGITKVTIIAIAKGYCEEEKKIELDIKPKTKAPKGILGDKAICQGNTYTYKAEKNIGDVKFYWTIKDGTTTELKEGQNVLVTWKSTGPYFVQLAQEDVNGNFCQSNVISIEVKKLSTMNLVGDVSSCLYDKYKIRTDEIQGLVYDWSISPADAGTFISKDSSEVEIIWNKSGSHTISLKTCAGTFVKSVTVNDLPNIVVSHPSITCENAVIAVNTTSPYSSYVWKKDDGSVVSTKSNPAIVPGTYIVEVTDAFQCRNVESFTIDAIPKPNINISTPDDLAVCPTTSNKYPKLYAVDADGGYSYDWMKNNISTGITTNTFSTADIGTYQVEVTDKFGCKNTSNAVGVIIDCNPSGGGGGGGNPNCTLPPNISTDFSFTNKDCNTIEFTSSSLNTITGSDKWEYQEPSGNVSIGSGSPLTYDFNLPAYYRVRNLVKYTDPNNTNLACFVYKDKAVEVSMKANFDFINSCVGDAIQFYDRSTFLPGKNITKWSWDFGDPSSSDNTSSTTNPTHTYAKEGSYIVTLQVDNGICTETYIKTITLYKKPNPSIQFSNANCEKETTYFKFSDNTDILKAEWTFGDNANISQNAMEGIEAYHTYNSSGVYNIEAKIKSIYDCNSSVTSSLTIEKNNLTGNILSSLGDAICEDMTSTLSFSNSTVTKFKWNTDETTQSINVAKADVYKVTVSDINGCNYIASDYKLVVNPSPKARIEATILVGINKIYDYDKTVSLCAENGVFFTAFPSTDYGYIWENNPTINTSSYTPILNAGINNITVTAKDKKTGCEAIISDIVVDKKNPIANIIITSDKPTPCEGDNTTLSVQNTQSTLTYTWNNNKNGSSIITKTAGTYFVTGKDSDGCIAKSNELSIQSGPDINLIPSGCFKRCVPDTLCYPLPSDVISYQWYKNSTAISAAEGGNIAFPIMSTSGDYYVEMESTNGCKAKSEVLSIEGTPALGTFIIEVYSDENSDGVYDAGDKPLKNIKVTVSGNFKYTNEDGKATFYNLVGGSYTAVLDSASFPSEYKVMNTTINFSITRCDEVIVIKSVHKKDCVTTTTKKEYISCDNKEVNIGGKIFKTDTIYKELIQISPTCFNTIIHTIKFGKKVDYSLTHLPSCANKATGTIKLDMANQNEFIIKVDGKVLSEVSTLNAGQHKIVFEDKLACKTEAVFETGKIPDPIFKVEKEDIDCVTGKANVSVVLENYKPENISILWSSGQKTPNITVDKIGKYTVKIDNGCDVFTEEIQIEKEVKEAVKYTIATENINCISGIANISLNLLNYEAKDLVILWSSGESKSSIVVNKAGEYNVVLFNGCETSTSKFSIGKDKGKTTLKNYVACDGVPIKLFEKKFTADTVIKQFMKVSDFCEDTTVHNLKFSEKFDYELKVDGNCENEDNGSITLDMKTKGEFKYFLSGKQIVLTDDKLNNLSPNKYNLIIQDNNGCKEVEEISISVKEPIEYEVIKEDISCFKGYADLAIKPLNYKEDDLKYEWSSNANSSSIRTKVEGEYKVIISNGCEVIEEKFSITNTEKLPNFDLPNILVGNENSNNSVLDLDNTNFANTVIKSFEIYDRSGRRVFIGNDNNRKWDAANEGRSLNSGVYVYVIRAEVDACGSVIEKRSVGSITLMK